MSSMSELSHSALFSALALGFAGIFTAALIAGLCFWPLTNRARPFWRRRRERGVSLPPMPPRMELVRQSRGLETANSQLRNRLNELSLLYEVAKSFTSTLELPEVLTRITTLIGEKLQIPRFSIMLLDAEGKLVVK